MTTKEAHAELLEAVASAIRMSYPGRGYTMKDLRTALEYGLHRWRERVPLGSDSGFRLQLFGELYADRDRSQIGDRICALLDGIFCTPTPAATTAEAQLDPDEDPAHCLKCGAKKRKGQRYVCDGCVEVYDWGPLADAWERGHGRPAFVREAKVVEEQSEPTPTAVAEDVKDSVGAACPTCGGSGFDYKPNEVPTGAPCVACRGTGRKAAP